MENFVCCKASWLKLRMSTIANWISCVKLAIEYADLLLNQIYFQLKYDAFLGGRCPYSHRRRLI